jgi:purine nucleosidase
METSAKNLAARVITPCFRVITDNDYAGDPDGLVQLAHLLLSPSVEVRAVIGSHLGAPGPFNTSGRSATESRDQADQIVGLLGLTGRIATLEGSNSPLPYRSAPIRSAGAEAIVEEAMRDSDLPLYITLGGGLTELASAYLMEPRIATRLTAIWIGGPEYPGVALSPPDPSDESEHNTRIDLAAAQVVFDSTVPLWQVPRDAYRQAFISFAELKARMRPCGPLGAHLYACLEGSFDYVASLGLKLGEVFILGDSPLVLLTALRSPFLPDPSSSRYATVPAPRIDERGRYLPASDGRPIRVYTHIDTRLMFEDMFAKLAEAASANNDPSVPKAPRPPESDPTLVWLS